MHAPATRRKTTVAALIRTAALALLAAFAVVGLGAGPALAADGDVAWTVRTASNSYGADRSSFSYAVNPGGRVEDALVVANRGTAPLDLAVYAADGFTTDTGQLDLLTKDKKSVGDRRLGPRRPRQRRDPARRVRRGPLQGHRSRQRHARRLRGRHPHLPDAVRRRRRASTWTGASASGSSCGSAASSSRASRSRTCTSTTPARSTRSARATPPSPTRIHNTGNAILSAQQTVSVSGPFGWLRAEAGADRGAAGAAPGRELEGDRARPRRGTRGQPGRDRDPHARCSPTRRAPPPRSNRSRPRRTAGPSRGRCCCWSSC